MKLLQKAFKKAAFDATIEIAGLSADRVDWEIFQKAGEPDEDNYGTKHRMENGLLAQLDLLNAIKIADK